MYYDVYTLSNGTRYLGCNGIVRYLTAYSAYSMTSLHRLPTSPYFSLLLPTRCHLPTSPYFSLLLPTSPYFSLLLPTSPYFSLLLPTSPYFSLLLPTSPYFSLLLPTRCHLPTYYALRGRRGA